jgi:hypothetical protein
MALKGMTNGVLHMATFEFVGSDDDRIERAPPPPPTAIASVASYRAQAGTRAAAVQILKTFGVLILLMIGALTLCLLLSSAYGIVH